MTTNRIDQLVTALSTGTAIPFARDAWDSKAPDEYGVVLFNGQNQAVWADDIMVDQAHQVLVVVYVNGASDTIQTTVQSILEAQDTSYRLESREYFWDIDRVEWRWTAWIYGPIEETAPDPEPTPTPTPDPEPEPEPDPDPEPEDEDEEDGNA